ncbi:MAG TPA: hypothetical protein ENH70_07050, partial [Desulfobacteraceae bacterium]|nr:hypothetical protein [Desulfobacteraceae bacterium]
MRREEITMKKSVFLIFCLAVACFLSTMMFAQPSNAAGVIKVGAVQPVTGRFAFAGVHINAGLEDALMMANAEGGINGRPVEIIIRDTKGDETEGLAAAKELIENQKVLALVGPSRSGTTLGLI